jgi:hypothetical protein
MLINQIYYLLKPFIPRTLQIALRRAVVTSKLKSCKNWPINEKSSTLPINWAGWPENKKFALVLTHDVESDSGQERCYQLSDLEKRLGFKSSFNFVPERYKVSGEIRDQLTSLGFEVGVHGLNHDGRLYENRELFKQRAVCINHYLQVWPAVGFRSPSMHHNLEWIHDLDIEYDSSTFDTDPFEPQSDGVETIYPFWVRGNKNQKGYVELPYTLPQDFTLFILMGKKNIDVWKKKLAWIVAKGGMALMNTHPDYMSFSRKKPNFDEYPVAYYKEFLEYIKQKYEGLYWHVLPREIAWFWKNKDSLRINQFKIQ